jgi:hypothetical protein
MNMGTGNIKDISFTVSSDDERLIDQIAERALAMDKNANGKLAFDKMHWTLDITAVHANGNPLRLEDFLKADDFNFAHDAFGIARKLDRSTGQLTDFFIPRFSKREKAA